MVWRAGKGPQSVNAFLRGGASPSDRNLLSGYVDGGLGLKAPLVATMEAAGRDFSFFVVYGRAEVAIDFAQVEVPEVTVPEWGFKEVNAQVKEKLGV